MGSKTRLSSYCTKRANNGVNLVTSRKINTRLARPMVAQWSECPVVSVHSMGGKTGVTPRVTPET